MNEKDLLNILSLLERVPITGKEAYVLVDVMEKIKREIEVKQNAKSVGTTT